MSDDKEQVDPPHREAGEDEDELVPTELPDAPLADSGGGSVPNDMPDDAA